MKKIKILYVEQNTDGTIGGSYYSLYYLVKGINKEIYDPQVIFYTNNELIEKFRNAGLKVLVFQKPAPLHFKWLNRKPLDVLRPIFLPVKKAINFIKQLIIPAIKYSLYIMKENIDIIHLNNSIIHNHDWMLAGLITRTKCLTHERGINENFAMSAKFFGKKLDAIICISNSVKNNMIERGVNFSNIKVIFNGLDPERVQIKLDSNIVREELKISANDFVVGISGNIKEWKGQEILISAVAKLRDKIKEIKCVIIGATAESDRYYENRLKEQVKKFNLRNIVIFTGYKKDIYSYLNIMDVVIHASILPEPFGRVLLEAMAVKKPVIGTNFGAVPEIIQDGKTGFTYEPGNYNQLAQIIYNLYVDKTKLNEMGIKGAERLKNYFNLKTNIELQEKLYRNILDA